MISTQVQLLINCIASLSNEDKAALFTELDKMEKPKPKKPVKKKKYDIDAMAQQILLKHRLKHSVAN